MKRDLVERRKTFFYHYDVPGHEKVQPMTKLDKSKKELLENLSCSPGLASIDYYLLRN